MLTSTFQETLRTKVASYWEAQLADTDFHQVYYAKATGKEGGHQLADSVDELTTGLLRTSFPLLTGTQWRNGKPSPRSMGDIWVRNEADVWHPMNVKTGLVGAEGQPNLVSLKKLLKALLVRQVDAYYLLFVKFAIDKAHEALKPNVLLVDLLEWLAWDASLFHFDSGPGQLMLKASQFFQAITNGRQPPEGQTMMQKVSALFAQYEDGERRLRENRERDLRVLRGQFSTFKEGKTPFSVDPEQQIKLGIQ